MTKVAEAPSKNGNGSTKTEVPVISAIIPKTLPQKKEEPIQQKKDPDGPQKKEMTLQEKILKIENLNLVIEKRTKLVETRALLEKFQISSNDFNCTLRLNDTDGNTFSTSFTPGIKKVIDFLKASFDSSIHDVETKIEL